MWLFLPIGFFSIVRIYGSDRFAVRARRREHLEKLSEYVHFSRDDRSWDIIESDKRDYRFRVSVNKAMLQEILAGAVKNLHYTNFKEEAGRVNAKPVFGPDPYVEALHDVWGTMYRIQPRKPTVLPKRRRPRRKAPRPKSE